MPLEPVFSLTLRNLKNSTEEANRWNQIQVVVEEIYNGVLAIAKSHCKTKYEYPLFMEEPVRIIRRGSGLPNTSLRVKPSKCDFINTNISDIIARIQMLFPDSLVKQRFLSKGDSGNLYDMTDLTDRMRPYFNEQPKPYIVVEW